MYAWLITKDHIAEPNAKAPSNQNAVGMMGPSGVTLTEQEVLNLPEKEFFQMFDDDKTLYYEGYMIHDKNSEGFEPLDDFGTPNAGCTYINYRNKETGEMEVL